MQVELDGEEFILLAGKGVYLPRHQTLLVADTHFGKESTFQRNHIPIPNGATEATLNGITRMMAAQKIARLVFLGDLFHARTSRAAHIMQALHEFFERHRGIEMVLTLGNHDRGLRPCPVEWNLALVKEFRLGRLQLIHAPTIGSKDVDLVVCGHIHPAVRMGSKTDRIGKHPCFWYSPKQLVLPAVGDFTGTHVIQRGNTDRVWVIADGHVVGLKPLG